MCKLTKRQGLYFIKVRRTKLKVRCQYHSTARLIYWTCWHFLHKSNDSNSDTDLPASEWQTGRDGWYRDCFTTMWREETSWVSQSQRLHYTRRFLHNGQADTIRVSAGGICRNIPVESTVFVVGIREHFFTSIVNRLNKQLLIG